MGLRSPSAHSARAVIAVDPVDFERDRHATPGTHATDTMKEAIALAQSMTNGQGADATIVTVGVVNGDHVAEAVKSIRKGGRVALAGVGGMMLMGVPINHTVLTVFRKRLHGAL